LILQIPEIQQYWRASVDELVADTDVIYHQAAQAGVRKSIEQPKKVNQFNVDGTVNILEAARNHDIKRVVVASSSSVYGKPQYLPYDEDHPTTPVSPYGVSKLATEQYARVYNEVYGLPTVSLRYFTVYGPRMRPNVTSSPPFTMGRMSPSFECILYRRSLVGI